jgi:hypothetical protein
MEEREESEKSVEVSKFMDEEGVALKESGNGQGK